MSKRLQEEQGGDDRYGGGLSGGGQAGMADQPTQATAAQMARRKIAATRKASGSQRSSRANTPTANPFGQPQQQSMPSFQPPPQSGTGFGGGFNFTAGNDSNPFAQQSQNGTPPPTSFQFGGAAPVQSAIQQNGGNGMFGNNTTSFGSTFGTGEGQSQQNGFNPSTSSMFANQNNTASTPSFSFGQTNHSQQNGATPSTNASFPTFGTQSENPFKNFGQSQQTQSTPSTSFGGFNSQPNGQQTQPQTNGAKSLFSTETPKTTTSSLFGGFGSQQTENMAPISSTAPTGGLFGSQSQNGTAKSLFGSTPPPAQSSDKPDGSVFLGLDSARAGTVKPGMFTSSNDTPKQPPSNPFAFGQQKDTTHQPQETPKSTSLFSNMNHSQQANGDKPSMFGANAAPKETPAPASNMFSFGQAQPQSTSTPGFKFGQNQASADDASMTTPGNTPQKPSLFATSSSHTAPAAEPAANQGKGLFDRIGTPAAAAPNVTATPSSSLFQPQAPKENSVSQPQTTASQSGGLFDRITRDTPATASKQTSFTPSTNLFDKASQSAAATPSAAPWLSHAPAAPQTTVTPPTPQRQIPQSTSRTLQPATGSKQAMLAKLNEGLIRHLEKEDPALDWTTIMEYYVHEAAKIERGAEPDRNTATSAKPTNTNSVQPQPPASDRTTATDSDMFGSATPKAPASATANMFANAYTQQTPKPSSLFQTQPPATAPVAKKRPGPFEEDDGDSDGQTAPATEKRLKTSDSINYPSLPENASTTARLFQAALDKSTSSSDKPTAAGFVAPTSSGGFKPSVPATGIPSFVAPASGGGGFLASFGKKASAEEEKQKKKRKAEDYDSDDETEEQWEQRDRAEQEAKRKKIEEAAKTASGFSVSRSVTPIPPPETPAGSGKNLFDRVSKEAPATAPSKPGFLSHAAANGNTTTSMFGSKTSTAASSSSLFSGQTLNKTGVSTKSADDRSDKENEHETGNTTWKPNTPIKFGNATTGTESTTPVAPPPRFGNLFGESKASATPSSNTGMLNIPSGKANLGFNFGGQPALLSGSRATTPGVTTDGEGASTAGEEEEPAQADPQVEDQSALHPQERETHNVLFEVAMAKASKIDEKRDAESGEVSKGWVEKGKGPLYILKNKETGKVSVLMKIKPLGRAAMNFSVQAKIRFEVVGNAGKQVQGAFVDTLADKSANQMSRWMIAVGKAEVAKELAKVLNEAAGVV